MCVWPPVGGTGRDVGRPTGAGRRAEVATNPHVNPWAERLTLSPPGIPPFHVVPPFPVC